MTIVGSGPPESNILQNLFYNTRSAKDNDRSSECQSSKVHVFNKFRSVFE